MEPKMMAVALPVSGIDSLLRSAGSPIHIQGVGHLSI
jgi:hypothetical protein